MKNFFNEVKRRNVVRVGIAYIIVGWLAFQLAEIVLPTFGAPDWIFKTLIFVIALGFPFVLLFAWAFEMTPDGVKKTRDVNIAKSVTASTGRKLDFIIIAALAVALGYFIWDRYTVDETMKLVAEPAAEFAETVSEELPAAAENEPSRSIAVLPFDDLSPDGDQGWFADGLAEEILNSLARTPDLLVAARTSSFAFKDSSQSVPAIAAALAVEHILEGSVRRSDSRLRVTAQLIRASDGFHLWSETFDRTIDDMIEIQENVAIEIAKALQTAMDPEALAKMVSSGTRSIPAFEAYLEGLAYGVSNVSSGDVYVYLAAQEAFERAIELDPKFAKAYWELSWFWSDQLGTANFAWGFIDLPREELLLQFEDAINNAIKNERDSATRTKYQAFAESVVANNSRALRLNNNYLEQRPNDYEAQINQMRLLVDLSRYEELEAAIDEFVARNGHDSLVASDAILHSLHIGNAEFIRRHALDALERLPDDIYVTYQAHRALLWTQDIDRASRLLPTLQASDLPDSSRLLASLRQACAENRHTEASKLFERIDTEFNEDVFMVWIGHHLRGELQDSVDVLMEFDEARDFNTLNDYVAYANFDPSPFPNLSARLEAQGVTARVAQELPYRCVY